MPYPAAHTMSTGSRTAAGAEWVSSAATITGTVPAPRPKMLPRAEATAWPP